MVKFRFSRKFCPQLQTRNGLASASEGGPLRRGPPPSNFQNKRPAGFAPPRVDRTEGT